VEKRTPSLTEKNRVPFEKQGKKLGTCFEWNSTSAGGKIGQNLLQTKFRMGVLRQTRMTSRAVWRKRIPGKEVKTPNNRKEIEESQLIHCDHRRVDFLTRLKNKNTSG